MIERGSEMGRGRRRGDEEEEKAEERKNGKMGE